MNQIIQIARRELVGFFDSLMGYVLIIMFLGFSGFFTWIYGDDIFFIGEANLSIFFKVAYWSLFFFIPSPSYVCPAFSLLLNGRHSTM